jgi:hypothetical protein
MAKRPKKERRTSPPEQTPGTPWLERLPAQVAFLAVLTLIAYGNSFVAGFHLDDTTMLANPDVVAEASWQDLLHPGAFRPLTILTFRANYLLAGRDPRSWHWVNVILHIGNAVLVLMLARRYLSPVWAASAAALFAVHPVQTEAVTYISQRASVLAAFFGLLTLLTYLRERRGVSLLFFALSLLAKEETIALAALPPLVDYVERRRPRLLYYSTMLLLAAGAAVRLFWSLGRVSDTNVGFAVKGVPNLLYALTQPRVLWKYLQLIVWPANQNLMHEVELSRGLWSPPSTALSLLALAGLAVALCWLVWLRRAPWVWVLGFIILVSPSSSFVAAADLMFEHRLYFPMWSLLLGVVWLLQQGLSRFGAPRGLVMALVSVWLAALTVATMARNLVWKDEVSLWSDVLAKSPRRPEPYSALGQALANRDPARARKLFERGLELNPRDPRLHTNLGVVLLSRDEPAAALRMLHRALELGGDSPIVWTNIAAAHLLQEQAEAGRQSAQRALALDPCYLEARRLLMIAQARLAGKAEAYSAGAVPAACRKTAAEIAAHENYRRFYH